MDQLPIEKFIKLLMALSILFLVTAFVALIFGLIEFKQWLDRRDDKIMAIEYCFTGNGEHYLCN